MTTIWHSSDHHFGHELVSNLRGFNSTDEHDQAIIENYIKNVKADDIVFFYGDLSGGSNGKTRRALEIIKKLPGRKQLIAGNHCPIHPMHSKAKLWKDAYNEVFEFVSPFMCTVINGEPVLQIHFPRIGDHTDKPRHRKFRMSDWEDWRIHGHTHSDKRLNYWGKELHVGLDAWDLCPVAQEEIIALMESNDN